MSHLDVATFLRQTTALVPSVPDVPTDEDTRLVRALVEVPFGEGVTPNERLAPYARVSDTLFDDLVADLDKRIRPSVGGDAFLAPDPPSRALSVLTATVAAVLGHPSCQRWAGKKRVVRADA